MSKINIGSRRIGLIFGGVSVEHEVSILSAAAVLEALRSTSHSVVPIYVDRHGVWRGAKPEAVLSCESIEDANAFLGGEAIAVRLSQGHLSLETNTESVMIDTLFPIIHGRTGEDGGLQGLCDVFTIPCVGSSVLGSAICMDKDVTKRLLEQAQIDVPKFLVVRRNESLHLNFGDFQRELGSPVFVKPCNMGSSVGVSKASSATEFYAACANALKYDDKCIVEQAINGREIEVGILEQGTTDASAVGEIIFNSGFYSFAAKYVSTDTTGIVVPADLDRDTSERARELALKVFVTLECRGMARVDMFLQPDGSLLVNEVNTIPGFTKFSMFPAVWRAQGITTSQLVEALIEKAIIATDRRMSLRSRQ